MRSAIEKFGNLQQSVAAQQLFTLFKSNPDYSCNMTSLFVQHRIYNIYEYKKHVSYGRTARTGIKTWPGRRGAPSRRGGPVPWHVWHHG